MRFKIFAIILLLQSVYLGQIYSEDFYSSVSGLEFLLASETYLLETLENYLQQVQLTNERILDFLDEAEENIKEIQENPVDYFENPLNAFKAIRRLAIDWKNLEDLVFQNHDGEEYAKNVNKMEKLDYANATRHDLMGAAQGLVRLQKTYELKATDISEGILQDWQYNAKLSAHDCFELGRSLYDAKENQYAAEWLLEARLLLNNELETNEGQSADERMSNDFPFISEVDILEYLAPSMFNIGNKKMALLLNQELLQLEPENEYGKTNQVLFEKSVKEERRIPLILKKQETPTQNIQKSSVKALYEAVCRGDIRPTAREQRNLRCRYATRNVPFCRLAPFKMEELSHDPFVAFYYDAIYDKEMSQILNTTEDYVERSTVGDYMQNRVSDIRTSKNTWLDFKQHEFLNPIHQRLRDITGLNLDYGEPLQIANYGIGGHYGPHYDFSDNADLNYPGQGNRLLTALFYINEVELGGATAFPFLKLAVPPIRGGLLVWYNMHESLELDYRTRHAGCPVLKGSKWICNEWFHQVGQEFNRPCSLERNGNISLELRYKE